MPKRCPEYLSPSAMALFNQSEEDYYLRYIAEHKSPGEPQNKPMSIGSAFDAYCKSDLHDKLFGSKNHPNAEKFEFQTIFEAQVEPQNRDWALIHGKFAFEAYKNSGAHLNLLSELMSAKSEPRFEFDLRGAINGHRDNTRTTIGEVTLLGKPDVAFVNRDGNHIILDFKVNGYCSNWPVTPMPGYIALRQDNGRNEGMHKNCSPYELGCMTINIGSFLEHHKADWAAQLAVYAWLVGESIGGDFIVAIDQLACNTKKSARIGFPSIRVAEHRLRVHADFQHKVFDRACQIWEIIHSDHFFRNLSKEDSQGRCELLDQRAESMYGSNVDQDFLDFTRR